MSKVIAETARPTEMLSFGGAQFASNIYTAFSAYYLMMFCTEVALIPSAVTAALLFGIRLFGAFDDLAASLFIHRMRFKDGKYLPYFKWCALPHAISMAALGLVPGLGAAAKVAVAVAMLVICELSWSIMHVASIAVIPYLAQDDVGRTKFVSFSNGSAISAYLIVSSFLLPVVDCLGGGSRSKGFALALALSSAVAAPLLLNVSFSLKERHFKDTGGKHSIKDILLAVGRNRRIMLFLAGFCLYSIADSIKSHTTYYYITYNMGRPDILSVAIMAGLISPLAMQPVIPLLLSRAKKEALIIFGLFASSCSSFLMLAAGARHVALIACIVLYGVFTSIVMNLTYTVVASFSDDIRTENNMNVSEIITASLGLSSSLGVAAASGMVPLVMAAAGYKAQAAAQTADALMGIKALYIVFTAAGMALAGAVLLLFLKKSKR